jgi:hypothetical protein
MGHIQAAVDGIMDMGLTYNIDEMAHAAHTLQMMVHMRVLHRLHPDQFANWYEE